MCLRFVFLLITRTASWLRLSQRQETWKIAEILLLRHQLAVLRRRQPRRPDLDWADRVLHATLLAVTPKVRHYGLRLLVSPDTIVRWHRDIVRRRWAARSIRGRAVNWPTPGSVVRTLTGFESPQHIAAHHVAQVTVHAAHVITMCWSRTVRAGSGHPADERR
jgi:hypothetical protein